MKRYINANNLIQEIEISRANNNHNNVIAFQTHNNEHRHFINMVLNQPTADVVEVIRCKDCKHSDKYPKWNSKEYLGCSWNGEVYEVEAEHYCSYGERRTSDD